MTSKKYYNSKHACKNVNIHVGDIVKVRKSSFVRKGQSHFSHPMVVKKIFCDLALLSDRKICIFSSLSMCRGGKSTAPPHAYSENHCPSTSPDHDWLLDDDTNRDSYPQETEVTSPCGMDVLSGGTFQDDNGGTSSNGESLEDIHKTTSLIKTTTYKITMMLQ